MTVREKAVRLVRAQDAYQQAEKELLLAQAEFLGNGDPPPLPALVDGWVIRHGSARENYRLVVEKPNTLE